jgi:hypothetical protein
VVPNDTPYKTMMSLFSGRLKRLLSQKKKMATARPL